MLTLPVPATTAVLYFTDNGRVLCGQHLGSSARYTGRDLSGQLITRTTQEDAEDFRAMGLTFACETCQHGH